MVYLGADGRPPEYAKVFALLSEDSVWNVADFPKERWPRKYINQVVVVCLADSPRQIKWESSCELVLKDDRVVFQDQPDVSVDLRQALVIRLNGVVETIPKDLPREKVIHCLKNNQSFGQ